MTKLKILIVEDKEENRKAAQEYFNTRDDVYVDFATTYDEAIEKLENESYAGAILDIEFPRTMGEGSEKLGLELGRQLDVIKGKYRVPHIFLSGGYVSHNKDVAMVFLDEQCAKKHLGTITPEKTEPYAWKTAYETLEKICPEMDEIFVSKQILSKFRRKAISSNF